MPGSIRLFVDAPLHAGAVVPASAGQAHYLASVMRRRPGETVRLFNGADGEWTGAITALDRRAGSFTVAAQTRVQTPEPDLWLAFALLKRDATDLVVQKATELGVAALLPVLTARTNAARANPERLAAIATEAAEQSERLTRPRLDPPVRLEALLAAWPPGRALFAAIERSAAPGIVAHRPAGLLIGPEGGFDPAEVDLLHRCPFVHPVSFGPRILRAETAAIAGLALLQSDVSR